MCTQTTWKYLKTHKLDHNKRKMKTLFAFSCLAGHNLRDPRLVMKTFLGQYLFVYAEKSYFLVSMCALMCVCVRGFLYLLKSIQRNRRGQEILLNGKAVCLCQCLCLLDTEKEREREEQTGSGDGGERERPIYRRLGLQRLNFISFDRRNGRYLHILCTQSQQPNIFSA